MKKLLVAAVAVPALMLAAAPAALAGGKDNVGCGLGTQVFGSKMNNSLVFQVLAATTNGISANQTFGISTGTLGCDKPSTVASNERLNEYVQGNMDLLARDIAMGKGETLDALAELMGVQAGSQSLFNLTLQANFAQIFPSEGVQSAHVIDAIVRVTQG
ncbi:MAG: hypothetical protein COX57_08910 [Alphaproteobacteria bacterium CG_4_10_14_0_2_um_filter_63_37]|nr:MAG: hypothetical protein AUJ55_05050 [Proteobacteria bacterium CG1_02_64_396]PJA24367.1 MAG: hypothetical protein COX57_08910 [Alphaproteobacteria bacterium CG_4_10_14_0_2_um_filter_63_37]